MIMMRRRKMRRMKRKNEEIEKEMHIDSSLIYTPLRVVCIKILLVQVEKLRATLGNEVLRNGKPKYVIGQQY
jgi:hypothetical protein